MKLSQCERGKVVKVIGNYTGRIFSYKGLVGHIIGLDEDDISKEILVKIECSNATIVNLLPKDLLLYQD